MIFLDGLTLYALQWLSLMRSMFKEAEWLKNNTIPTMDDYMQNAYVSFALGPIVLPALYLVGPKLSDDPAELLADSKQDNSPMSKAQVV